MHRPAHLDRNPGSSELHSCEMTDVAFLHQRTYGALRPTRPVLAADSFWDFRMGFLREEMQELNDAHKHGDLLEVGDALVDIAYVAMGTAWWLGLPWESMWAAVHAANLAKKPGTTKRNHPLDLVKGPDWVRPDHAPHFLRAGWHPDDQVRFDPVAIARRVGAWDGQGGNGHHATLAKLHEEKP